jgi:hypothetical protein
VAKYKEALKKRQMLLASTLAVPNEQIGTAADVSRQFVPPSTVKKVEIESFKKDTFYGVL